MEQPRAYRYSGFIVHWQVVLLLFVSSATNGQTRDSVRADSNRTRQFSGTNSQVPPVIRRERTLDGAISGGVGFYSQQAKSNSQTTANLDFNAQTSILDLIAGFHWGFTSPSTKSVSLGLRFPVTQNEGNGSGVFADAAFLFFDSGHDTNGFQSGLRMALTGRNGPAHLEYRLAAEIRRVPIGQNTLETWGGIELGFFTNILREEIRDPTRKDSLRYALRYIATTDELESMNSVNSDESLDSWLDKFWRVRDVTPNTPQNEAREEYERRIAVVNKEYGTPHHLGVTTDQGRVLLLYGEPSHVESVPSVLSGSRRYMLWVYSNRVKGYPNAIFLFESDNGAVSSSVFAAHGLYRQVYSNILGEQTEGIPFDLPPTMMSYIQSFGG